MILNTYLLPLLNVLVPLLTTAIFVLLLLTLSIAVSDFSYNTGEIELKSLKGSEAADILLPKISGWKQEYVFEDRYVKSVLQQDATMAFRYLNENDSSKVMWVSIQISKGTHVWEDSLVYEPTIRGEQKANVIEDKDVIVLENPSTKGRLFVYQRPNSTHTEAVLYWFEKSQFKVGSSLEDRNVLISLWNYEESLVRSGLIHNKDAVDQIEKFYISFAKPIAIHWTKIAREGDYVDGVFNPFTMLLLLIGPIIYFVIRLQLNNIVRIFRNKP